MPEPIFNPLTGLLEVPGLSTFVDGTITPTAIGIEIITAADVAAVIALLGGGVGSVSSVQVAVAAGSAAALSAAGGPIITTGTITLTVDAALVSIAGLTTAADTGIYTTASNVYATYTLTSYARTLLDDANATAAQSTLGLVIGTNVQAWSADLDSFVANSSYTGANLTLTGDLTVTGDITASSASLVIASLSITGNLTVGGTTALSDSLDLGGNAITGVTDISVGSVSATTLSGDGSALTDLNATELTTGTVDNARLDSDLQALAANTGTGLWSRTGSGTGSVRTITGTSNKITVTDGDGVAGNPTLTISSTYVGQNTITTLGTIGTGVWNGTVVGISYGGTGANTGADARTNLGIITKRKTGNTSRSGTTVTTADPELTLTIASFDSMVFDLWVICTSASGTPNIKFGMSFPSSPTYVAWSADFYDYDALTMTPVGFQQSALTSMVATIPAAQFGVIRISGTLENGANAGSIAFWWAQNVSDATATTVSQGSKMVLRYN